MNRQTYIRNYISILLILNTQLYIAIHNAFDLIIMSRLRCVHSSSSFIVIAGDVRLDEILCTFSPFVLRTDVSSEEFLLECIRSVVDGGKGIATYWWPLPSEMIQKKVGFNEEQHEKRKMQNEIKLTSNERLKPSDVDSIIPYTTYVFVAKVKFLKKLVNFFNLYLIFIVVTGENICGVSQNAIACLRHKTFVYLWYTSSFSIKMNKAQYLSRNIKCYYIVL